MYVKYKIRICMQNELQGEMYLLLAIILLSSCFLVFSNKMTTSIIPPHFQMLLQ
jgi:hypothetical protein